MALHKVSELEGALLDAAVAKALGHTLVESMYRPRGGKPAIILGWDVDSEIHVPAYSSNWAQGGPIIGRERIGFQHHAFRVGHETHNTVDAFLPGRHHQSGPTMLIAAMRAFVASHFGEEVEL